MTKATETTTVNDAIRDWLLLVGAEYSVREAHYIKRPDDSLKPVRNWFTYRFDSSVATGGVHDLSTDAGSNVADMEFSQTFERLLTISCHGSADGLEIIEALLVSAYHPAVNDIIDAARLVIVDIPDAIANETVDDETDIDYVYTAQFRIRKNTSFALSRADHIWDNYNVGGTLTQADDVGTLPVTITDT